MIIVRALTKPERLRQVLQSSPPSSPLQRAAEAILYVAIAFGVFAFGATQAWSQFIWLAGVAVALTLAILATAGVPEPIKPIHPVLWVVPAFLALILIQLLPVSADLVLLLSPAAATLRHDVLGQAAAPTCLTVYPHATTTQLHALLGVIAVFATALLVLQTPADVGRALLALTLIGCGVVGLAAWQHLTNDGTIYGVVPTVHRHAGPFKNYSHFAQASNISIGSALGLLLARLHRNRHDTPAERLRAAWPLLSVVLVAAATIVLSLSRMGTISMLAAAGVVGLCATPQRRSGLRAGIVLVALTVLVLVLLLGFNSGYAKFAQLVEQPTPDAVRLSLWRDAGKLVADYPAVGSGLGTFQWVFPAYDRTLTRTYASHAENEYIQIAAETGLMGLALTTGFLAGVLATAIRLASPGAAHASGMTFGLGAIATHSMTDFGQHVPGLAALTALLCATVLASWRINRRSALPAPIPSSTRLSVLTTPAILPWAALLVGVVGYALPGTYAQWRAESLLEQASAAPLELSPLEHRRVSLLEQALAWQPADADLRVTLAAAQWSVIERELVERELSPQTTATINTIVAQLTHALSQNPSSGRAMAMLANLNYYWLDTPAGERQLELAYRLWPQEPTVCLRAAEVRAARGDWSGAMDAARRAVVTHASPQTAAALFLRHQRADLAHELCRNQLADLLWLAEQIAADPNSRTLHQELINQAEHFKDLLGSTTAAEHAACARLAESRGRPDDAIDHLTRAVALEYHNVNIRLELARVLARNGRSAEAMQHARVALRLQPDSAQARDLIARCSVTTPP